MRYGFSRCIGSGCPKRFKLTQVGLYFFDKRYNGCDAMVDMGQGTPDHDPPQHRRTERCEAVDLERGIPLEFAIQKSRQVAQADRLGRPGHGYRASRTDTGDVRATEAALLPRK